MRTDKVEKILAIDLKRGTGVADPQVAAIVDRPIAAAPTLRPLVAWVAIVALIILAVIRSAIATQSTRSFSCRRRAIVTAHDSATP